MRRLVIILAALCLSWSYIQASPAGDLKVIKRRLQTSFTTTGTPTTEVERILGDLTATGQFSQVDYDDNTFNSGGEKRKHLANITKLARAYQMQGNKYYKSREVYNAMTSALNYWVDANIQDENWWHRIIGFPKDLMVPLLLISDDLQKFDTKLFDKCMQYELYSWSQPKQRAQEGANGTDICKFTFTAAVMTGNVELLSEVVAKANSLVRIVHGDKEEGIQADFSFSQHTGNGRQLYLATYGREYVDGVLYFMELINGTSFEFSPEKIDIVERLFLDGVAWPWYKKEMDASQCGRKIEDENTGPSFVQLTRRLQALNTPRKEELGKMIDMMNGKSELIGNKLYWRHDYMLHRGAGYWTTARMTSTRTVGNEAGNGQGFLNYHTGDGANYIKVNGNEYSPIYKQWNWKRIPGTTVMADSRPMPRPMWGAGGEGKSEFASGVSDLRSGVSGFIYAKDSLKAHKSWFFFDNYFVALGAGISSMRADAPAITTLNQCSLAGDVVLTSTDGKESKLANQAKEFKKLWHSNIGYFVEGETAPYNVQIDKIDKGDILWIATNHGTAPKQATYAYSVYPNIDKDAFAGKNGSDYRILSNTPSVQAVADNATGKIMAVFYTPGTLDTGKTGPLSVDKPTIMIVEPTGNTYKVTVSNPFCESRDQGNVTIGISGKTAVVEFKDGGQTINI